MNEYGIIWFTVMIFFAGADFLLRSKFAKKYLRLSIPVFSKTEEKIVNADGLVDSKIYELENSKLIYDAPENTIWLQCKFKNNRSTLGLIQKIAISKDGKGISSRQPRLSLGAFFTIICALGLISVQTEQYAHIAPDLIHIKFFPVFFILGMIINYVFAYRRLNKETDQALAELRGQIRQDHK